MPGRSFNLRVRVQPSSKRNEVRAIQVDGRIKVALAAPPVDDKANQALLKFLSGLLGIAKADIQISKGAISRDKLLTIAGISEVEAQTKLRQSSKG